FQPPWVANRVVQGRFVTLGWQRALLHEVAPHDGRFGTPRPQCRPHLLRLQPQVTSYPQEAAKGVFVRREQFGLRFWRWRLCGQVRQQPGARLAKGKQKRGERRPPTPLGNPREAVRGIRSQHYCRNAPLGDAGGNDGGTPTLALKAASRSRAWSLSEKSSAKSELPLSNRWLLPDGEGSPSKLLIAASATPRGPQPVAAGTLKVSSVATASRIARTAVVGKRTGSGSGKNVKFPDMIFGLSTIGSLSEPMKHLPPSSGLVSLI